MDVAPRFTPSTHGAPADTISPTRSVVLIGLMGAGKSSVGRKLARQLGASFADADDAIVEAAGMSIAEIFSHYGEPAFRDLERRVVLRLLVGKPGVIALGGGAFMDPTARHAVAERGISFWLRADLDTLVARTARKRAVRPLLAEGDHRATLSRLMDERYPVYAAADHAIDTAGETADAIAQRIAAIIRDPLRHRPARDDGSAA